MYLILNGEKITDAVSEQVANSVAATDEQKLQICQSKYGHVQFKYINGELVQDDEFIAAHELSAKRASASLSRREFFQALITAGLYDQVKALETDPLVPLEVRVDLIEATSFDRMYPSLISMASSMGIDDAQLDSIFGII